MLDASHRNKLLSTRQYQTRFLSHSYIIPSSYLLPMQSYVLGIDIGTGSTKAVAVNAAGKILFATQAPYPEGFSHTEQDPEIIWDAFASVIKTSLKQLKQPPLALALSSAMHSIMAVLPDGRPLSPLLTWADDRASEIAAALLRQPEGQVFYSCCGTPVHALSPLCKIRWWQENEGDLFRKTAKFVGIKEWVWHRLFGVFEIDYSLASATGMLELERKIWYAPALAFAGIEAIKLSHPVPTTKIRSGLDAALAKELQLPTAIPFIIGGSDGCLANLGTAALRPGTAAITVGTSGAVRVATDKPTPVFPEQLFNYYLDESYWIKGGAINNGGAAVQWITQAIGRPSIDEQLIEAITTIAPGSEGLLFLPYLLGERAPLWDSNSSAAFIGLRQQHSSLHLLRAVIEGVCFALRSVLEPLEAVAGKVNEVHLSGGFTRSDAALQVLADCLGKKVVLLQTEDASAIGAALLGYKALGMITDLEQLPIPEIVKTFVPEQSAHTLYTRLFALYQPLYGTLKNTLHQLRLLS